MCNSWGVWGPVWETKVFIDGHRWHSLRFSFSTREASEGRPRLQWLSLSPFSSFFSFILSPMKNHSSATTHYFIFLCLRQHSFLHSEWNWSFSHFLQFTCHVSKDQTMLIDLNEAYKSSQVYGSVKAHNIPQFYFMEVLI